MTDTAQIQIDEYPDADDHITIRLADGTPTGNTDEQPIATVYAPLWAEHIVKAANCHDELVAAVQRFVALFGEDKNVYTKIAVGYGQNVLAKAEKA